MFMFVASVVKGEFNKVAKCFIKNVYTEFFSIKKEQNTK